MGGTPSLDALQLCTLKTAHAHVMTDDSVASQVGCGPDGCQSPAADENLMLVTANGLISRTKLLDVKVYGLGAKGLRLLKLGAGDVVQSVTPLKATAEVPLGSAATLSSSGSYDEDDA